jgi:XTP/dITP diphosphohydrolase
VRLSIVDELVIASRNRGKIREIEHLLAGCVGRVRSLDEFAHVPEVVEDGETFEENALKKGRAVAAATGLPALADDSGLIVDALDGRPGVRSARFSGEGATDASNNAKLLEELRGVPSERRIARFRCVAALCRPDGECRTFSGELEGVILDGPRGSGGFGYDPLFLVPEFAKTLAEIHLEIKNAASHRGKALRDLKLCLARNDVR